MRRWLLFFVVVTLLVSACGQNKKQDSFGIDVSHHNGKINWGQLPDVVMLQGQETGILVEEGRCKR